MKASWDDYSQYEPQRDPTPFTRTCASRMAHRLRQTSIIFRRVKILLAHRRSKWTNAEAGSSNISIYYAFNVRLSTKSWQPYACLNSQNYHPPHGTPNFMAFPTYKLGCDRRYIPMVSMTNSTSCQSTLSSTSPWHTADQIDFLFSGHLLMLLVSSAQLPALSQISWFSAQNRVLPRSSSTSNNSSSSRPSSRPLQSLSKTSPGWVLTGCNFNEVRTRCERGPNEVQNQILGD